MDNQENIDNQNKIEKKKQAQREYYLKNREKRLKYGKEYYRKNKSKVDKYFKEYYEKNKTVINTNRYYIKPKKVEKHKKITEKKKTECFKIYKNPKTCNKDEIEDIPENIKFVVSFD